MSDTRFQQLILSSQLVNLIEVLYVLVIDYIDNGSDRRPDSQTATELKHLGKPAVSQWGTDLPALRNCLNAAIAGRSKAENLAILGQEIKQKFQEFRANNRFTSQEIELLASLGSYLRTDSEVALKKIQKLAGIVNNPFISERLAPEVGDQHDSGDALKDLVHKMVGRDDTALTLDEARQVKETHPDLYKEYLTYRKQHNQVWKDAMVSYIRSSKHTLVPYEEVLNYLHANGIDHMLPLGFTGMMDDMGRLYTNDGHAIDGVPQAGSFPSVIMNTKYGKAGGGDWVFMAERPDGSAGPYFYTADYKKAAARHKFEKVAELAPKITSMQKRWFQLVKKFNPADVHSVAAVVLEILYEFSARVGSIGNAAAGSATFGVSTLTVKHASVDTSGNVTLRYNGKDGVKTVHKLLKADPNQKFVIAAILQLLHGKQPRDRLFTITKPNGKFLPVGGKAVNDYFKSLGAPEGVTVHKLRTFRGTSMFQELVNNLLEGGKLPKDEKQALALFNKMAEVVGKQLNHVRRGGGGQSVTGTTALANYIDPSIQLMYWHTLGFRIPRFLEKFDNIS